MKETPWYPGETKPVYVGPYKRKIGRVVVRSYWDGQRWRVMPVGRSKARRFVSAWQNVPWKGVAK